MSPLLQKWNQSLERMPIVSILRGLEPSHCIEVASVLFEAGIEILEIPLNSPEPFKSISLIKEKYPEKIVGAGTVTSVEQVEHCCEVGSNIIVAPNFNAEIAEATLSKKMIYCPGVLTPTECFHAIAAGAHALKLFPAELGGPKLVSAYRSVLPSETKLIAVGSVNAANLKILKQAGASGFGIGSALFEPELSISEIQKRTKNFVNRYIKLDL